MSWIFSSAYRFYSPRLLNLQWISMMMVGWAWGTSPDLIVTAGASSIGHHWGLWHIALVISIFASRSGSHSRFILSYRLCWCFKIIWGSCGSIWVLGIVSVLCDLLILQMLIPFCEWFQVIYTFKMSLIDIWSTYVRFLLFIHIIHVFRVDCQSFILRLLVAF